MITLNNDNTELKYKFEINEDILQKGKIIWKYYCKYRSRTLSQTICRSDQEALALFKKIFNDNTQIMHWETIPRPRKDCYKPLEERFALWEELHQGEYFPRDGVYRPSYSCLMQDDALPQTLIDAKESARRIRDNIQYYSHEEFETCLKKCIYRYNKTVFALPESEKKFYLYKPIHRGEIKSNEWVTLLALKYLDTTYLQGSFGEDIQDHHVLLFDDGCFSGKQLGAHITDAFIDPKITRVSVVAPFMTLKSKKLFAHIPLLTHVHNLWQPITKHGYNLIPRLRKQGAFQDNGRSVRSFSQKQIHTIEDLHIPIQNENITQWGSPLIRGDHALFIFNHKIPDNISSIHYVFTRGGLIIENSENQGVRLAHRVANDQEKNLFQSLDKLILNEEELNHPIDDTLQKICDLCIKENFCANILYKIEKVLTLNREHKSPKEYTLLRIKEAMRLPLLQDVNSPPLLQNP